MRAVGAEKSSTIGAELLNYFLGRHWALRNNLLCYVLRSGFSVGAGYLHGLRLDQFHRCIRL
jgi:hypothetical protein